MLPLTFVKGGGFHELMVCWVQATVVANNNYKSGDDVMLWGKRSEIECWSADKVGIRQLTVVLKMRHYP